MITRSTFFLYYRVGIDYNAIIYFEYNRIFLTIVWTYFDNKRIFGIIILYTYCYGISIARIIKYISMSIEFNSKKPKNSVRFFLVISIVVNTFNPRPSSKISIDYSFMQNSM